MSTLFMWYFSYGFRIFVWVAARLLHTEAALAARQRAAQGYLKGNGA